jgi:hypothetical protein
MVITIKKGESKKEIAAAVKRLTKKKAAKPALADFYGKLKGKFGDGLTYQKQLRNEWD